MLRALFLASNHHGITLVARKPIGARAITPAERQQRRRDRLKAKHQQAIATRLAQPLPYSPELAAIRTNIGKLASYLTTLPDPSTVAHAVAAIDGPALPYPMLKAGAGWLARFAEAYRFSVLLRQDQAAKPVAG